MKKQTILAVSIIALFIIASDPYNTTQAQSQSNLKFAQKYRPHYFQHVREPWVIDRSIGFYIKRDGADFRKPWPTPLPPQCWAITYWFIWNGEDDYDNSGRSRRPDPEPVIVFVADNGQIVGMQSRIHGKWLPIVAPRIIDIHSGTHVMVGFAPWPDPRTGRLWFVHSPLCGQAGVQWLNVNGGAKGKGHFYPLMPVSQSVYPH